MMPDGLFFSLSATRSQTDDSYKNKFLISEKENVHANRDRDTEMLILAKDSGKQFTSSSSVHIGGGESDTYCPLLDKHWLFSQVSQLFLDPKTVCGSIQATEKFVKDNSLGYMCKKKIRSFPFS